MASSQQPLSPKRRLCSSMPTAHLITASITTNCTLKSVWCLTQIKAGHSNQQQQTSGPPRSLLRYTTAMTNYASWWAMVAVPASGFGEQLTGPPVC